jgi:Spy/CpxP family protein refolding chaperone
MFRISVVAGVAVVGAALLVADKGLTQGEKKEPTPKLKGQLPQYWKNLGLTEAQKQQVYDTRAKYATKIGALTEQLKVLRQQVNPYQNPRTQPGAVV